MREKNNKKRTQAELAKLAEYRSRWPISGLLLTEGCNASPAKALKLGEITDSNPLIWMHGGCKTERQQAVKAWLDSV